MSRRVGSRAFAIGSFAVAVAAGTAAVLSAIGAPASGVQRASAADTGALTSGSVAFAGGRVAAGLRSGGLVCFRVTRGSSTVGRSCAARLAADQIAYASSRYAVGGLAGAQVRAVIVRLTRKGTVWATLRRGAFYAAVPAGHNVRAVVKVERDGVRTAFTVTGSR